jgi:hypothetical protein
MSMIGARVTFDAATFRAAMDKEAARIKVLLGRTANELAFLAREAVQEDMKRVFDRPSRYVLNGMRIIRVPKDGGADAAILTWKDPEIGDIATGKIVRAQVEGGQRRAKRFEAFLAKVLGLPANLQVVPARGQRLDANGNLTGKATRKIIDGLKAAAEKRDHEGLRYILIRTQQRRGLRPGIYTRSARGKIKVLALFIAPPAYRARFAPADVARRVVVQQSGAVWVQALTRTLPDRRGQG